MRVLVIGGQGNMGKRYCSILKYLGCKYDILDVFNLEQSDELIALADKYIIATPTETHLEYLQLLIPIGRQILCEKPLAMELGSLKKLLRGQDENVVLMVNNYGYAYHLSTDSDFRYLDKQDPDIAPGLTLYNYYNSGHDGLIWDCVQLIRMAAGPLHLKKTSPIWRCIINGIEINRDVIDQSYVLMVADFIGGFMSQDVDELIETHETTRDIEVEYITSKHSEYWSSGEDYEQTTTE